MLNGPEFFGAVRFSSNKRLELLWTGRWRRALSFPLVLFLRRLSGRHLRTSRRRRIYGFGFVFATVRAALSRRSATFLTGWRHCRLLEAFVTLSAWLIETFTRSGCAGR